MPVTVTRIDWLTGLCGSDRVSDGRVATGCFANSCFTLETQDAASIAHSNKPIDAGRKRTPKAAVVESFSGNIVSSESGAAAVFNLYGVATTRKK